MQPAGCVIWKHTRAGGELVRGGHCEAAFREIPVKRSEIAASTLNAWCLIPLMCQLS